MSSFSFERFWRLYWVFFRYKSHNHIFTWSRYKSRDNTHTQRNIFIRTHTHMNSVHIHTRNDTRAHTRTHTHLWYLNEYHTHTHRSILRMYRCIMYIYKPRWRAFWFLFCVYDSLLRVYVFFNTTVKWRCAMYSLPSYPTWSITGVYMKLMNDYLLSVLPKSASWREFNFLTRSWTLTVITEGVETAYRWLDVLIQQCIHPKYAHTHTNDKHERTCVRTTMRTHAHIQSQPQTHAWTQSCTHIYHCQLHVPRFNASLLVWRSSHTETEVWKMSYYDMWHDIFRCMEWIIEMSDKNCQNEWQDSSTCVS